MQLERPAGRVAAVLLLISVIAFILPAALTGRLSDVMQVIAPFQDGVQRVTEAIGRAWPGREPDNASGANSQAADREIAALRSLATNLAARNRRLVLENDALTRIRGRGLGVRGRLIPARAVADDAAYWRDSKLILSGLRSGVDRADGVLSNHFSIDASGEDGIEDGMGLLSREVLVGLVDRAGPYTSRVRLLSDPETRMSVAIGRLSGETFETVDAAFWLAGAGHGRIEVREVHHQYIKNSAVRLGDFVLTRDDEPRLPPSIMIGTITELAIDPDSSLLYTLQVSPGVEVDELRRVYVVDTD